MDITSSIANLSMGMSMANTASQVSTKMLSKTLDSTEQLASNMIEDIANIPASSSYAPPGGVAGHLMDIRV